MVGCSKANNVCAGFHVVRTLSIGKTHHFFQQMTLKLVALFRGLPRGHRSPHGVLPTFDAVKGLVAASCKAATVSDVWTAVLSSSQGAGHNAARSLLGAVAPRPLWPVQQAWPISLG